MKAIRKLILIGLGCLCGWGVQAQKYRQMMQDPQASFREIMQEANRYFAERGKGKGTGYTQFMRWANFHRTRLTREGKIANVAKRHLEAVYQEYQEQGNKPTLYVERSNWQLLGPTDGTDFTKVAGIGRVNCVAIDPINPNIVYVGTPAGGLWRSTTGGDNWISLTDGISTLGVSGIVVQATTKQSPRTIYILTGDGDGEHIQCTGVLKSTDDGITWQSTQLTWNASEKVFGYKLIASPGDPNTLWVVTNRGLYELTKGGDQVLKVLAGNHCYDLEFHPKNSSIMYVATNVRVKRSENKGKDWSDAHFETNLPSTSEKRLALAVTPAAPDKVYCLVGVGAAIDSKRVFGGMYLSTDKGQKFRRKSHTPNILGWKQDGSDAGNQYSYDLALAVNPKDGSKMITGGVNCWTSDNEGADWTVRTDWYRARTTPKNYTHADIHALEYFRQKNGSYRLFCGSDGGFYVSDDGGHTWQNKSKGLAISQVYHFSLHPKNHNILYGLQDNGTNVYNEYSKKLRQVAGGDGLMCHIDPANTHIWYVSNPNGEIYQSTNGGKTFPNKISGNHEGAWLTPYILNPRDHRQVYMGYKSLYRYESSSGVLKKLTKEISDEDITYLTALSGTKEVFFLQKNQLYKYTGPREPTSLNLSTPAEKTSVEVTPNKIWVSSGGFVATEKVYQSDNGGKNWINISKGLPNVPVNHLRYYAAKEELFAATDIGVYIKKKGKHWERFNNGLPKTIVKYLAIKNDVLYAATFGRGLWRAMLDGCPTRISFGADVQSGKQRFEAKKITSKATIAGKSDITYQATEEVKISPGFHLTPGSEFYIRLAACGQVKKANTRQSNRPTGIYTGPMSTSSIKKKD
ncbi:MAG TPA: hypothetical protein DCS93_11740 [Microscillaceae bacterium]|nr:hypothetical protein [Microscillaceae bacterium]